MKPHEVEAIQEGLKILRERLLILNNGMGKEIKDVCTRLEIAIKLGERLLDFKHKSGEE